MDQGFVCSKYKENRLLVTSLRFQPTNDAESKEEWINTKFLMVNGGAQEKSCEEDSKAPLMRGGRLERGL